MASLRDKLESIRQEILKIWEGITEDSPEANSISEHLFDSAEHLDIANGILLDNAHLNRYEASTKKSKQPSINDISFEANVNSLRKTNYAKCGNINTTIRERK